MKEITISQDDILEMNIRVAKDFLVEANTTPYREEKLKALFMAYEMIKRSLLEEGIDVLDIKIKKKKKNV